MLRDWGSRDDEFIAMTAEIQRRLLAIAGCESGHVCVPMLGSGTFAVESMIGTLVRPDGKALVLANGAYGRRAAAILARIGRAHEIIDKGDYLPPRGTDVAAALDADHSITHVVAVHCETSTGILNPIEEIAAATRDAGRRLLVDSMSAFGALPICPQSVPFEALAALSNKCLEGAPGIGFIIAREDSLSNSKGNCHSLSLDAHAQWQGFLQSGEWRFTPPTHVAAAFLEALRDHEQEGGVEARGRRYTENWDVVVSELRSLGFETLLPDDWQAPIIVTFLSPADPAFDFNRFYELIRRKGYLIYPGKLTEADSFRIGCIGCIDEKVMRDACHIIKGALLDLGVRDAAPPESVMRERDELLAA